MAQAAEQMPFPEADKQETGADSAQERQRKSTQLWIEFNQLTVATPNLPSRVVDLKKRAEALTQEIKEEIAGLGDSSAEPAADRERLEIVLEDVQKIQRELSVEAVAQRDQERKNWEQTKESWSPNTSYHPGDPKPMLTPEELNDESK